MKKKNSVFEIVLSVLIFAFVMVWGNNAKLCAIFPIVGGAIGGGISGAGTGLSMILMRRTENVFFKLLIWLACFAGTVLICFLIAQIILSAAAA